MTEPRAASGEGGAAPYNDPGMEVGMAGPGFVTALADVLMQLASLAGRPQRVTKFHCVRAPQLSIRDYLARISKYFQCSRECFVLCLVYIDRIVKRDPDFTICNLNIHRLLVTGILLAVKFFDDVYYSNAYYAQVGGVRTREINALEISFLQLIDWRLHVSPQEYEGYRNHVCMAAGGSPAPAISDEPRPSVAHLGPQPPSVEHSGDRDDTGGAHGRAEGNCARPVAGQ